MGVINVGACAGNEDTWSVRNKDGENVTEERKGN
jgi:hypothetical protein